jgi:hypothetical protein
MSIMNVFATTLVFAKGETLNLPYRHPAKTLQDLKTFLTAAILGGNP